MLRRDPGLVDPTAIESSPRSRCAQAVVPIDRIEGGLDPVRLCGVADSKRHAFTSNEGSRLAAQAESRNDCGRRDNHEVCVSDPTASGV